MSFSKTNTDELSGEAPPPWWNELQEAMGLLLRMPLDANQGRFRAPIEHYAPELVSQIRNETPGVHSRLALYHEQYWKRLFTVVQEIFPRTACGVGYFYFNQLVSAYLRAYPPRGFDLADIGEHFFDEIKAALEELVRPMETGPAASGYRIIETTLYSLSSQSPSISELGRILGKIDAPWSLISQALHMDEAERRAFRAPWEPEWHPSPAERAGLLSMRLRYAASFSLLRLDYKLPQQGSELSELKKNAFPRRESPLHWVIARAPRGIASCAVDPIFARLLTRARHSTLGEAIAQTEQALAHSLRDHWRRSLEGYIQAALRRGFWIGEQS